MQHFSLALPGWCIISPDHNPIRSHIYYSGLSCYDLDLCSRCANYTLLVPSKVNAGTNLEGLLTILYDSPSDVTAKITSSEGGDSMQTSIPSPDGNGK